MPIAFCRVYWQFSEIIEPIQVLLRDSSAQISQQTLVYHAKFHPNPRDKATRVCGTNHLSVISARKSGICYQHVRSDCQPRNQEKTETTAQQIARLERRWTLTTFHSSQEVALVDVQIKMWLGGYQSRAHCQLVVANGHKSLKMQWERVRWFPWQLSTSLLLHFFTLSFHYHHSLSTSPVNLWTMATMCWSGIVQDYGSMMKQLQGICTGRRLYGRLCCPEIWMVSNLSILYCLHGCCISELTLLMNRQLGEARLPCSYSEGCHRQETLLWWHLPESASETEEAISDMHFEDKRLQILLSTTYTFVIRTLIHDYHQMTLAIGFHWRCICIGVKHRTISGRVPFCYPSECHHPLIQPASSSKDPEGSSFVHSFGTLEVTCARSLKNWRTWWLL